MPFPPIRTLPLLGDPGKALGSSYRRGGLAGERGGMVKNLPAPLFPEGGCGLQGLGAPPRLARRLAIVPVDAPMDDFLRLRRW